MNALQAQLAERRLTVITDTRHLLAAGEWPPRIATRLGYKDVDSLREAMRRWQADDLADRLQRSAWDNITAEPTNQHQRRWRRG